MCRFVAVIAIERQCRSLCLLQMGADPGIFICEPPGRDSRAPGMFQASAGDSTINICLTLQVIGVGTAFGVDGKGNVHFGDVDLNSQRGEAFDIGRDGRYIRVQIRDVHLKSNAINRNPSSPEISDHGVDRIRLSVDDLSLGLVIEEQSLWIGLTCPPETAFDISAAVFCQSDAGLIAPDRAAERSGMNLVEGLVDNVPREDATAVMSDYCLYMFFKNCGEFVRSKFPIGQPFRILAMPNHRVAANLHVVPVGEIYDPIGL